jgi:hypothetical protein
MAAKQRLRQMAAGAERKQAPKDILDEMGFM